MWAGTVGLMTVTPSNEIDKADAVELPERVFVPVSTDPGPITVTPNVVTAPVT